MSDQRKGTSKFTVRRGEPWPFVRCEVCGGSRHYETPQTTYDWDEMETDMVKFALAHKACGRPGTRGAEGAPGSPL